MNQVINKEIKRNMLLNPGPATTSVAVKEALIVSDICPRETEFGELLRDVRIKSVGIVNGAGDYECILLGGSGTGAIESCLSSCVEGDSEILIIENGAYGDRMGQICETLDIPYQLLKFEWGNEIDLKKVEEIIGLNKKIKVMAFIHHETTTGILNDLVSLDQLAKKHNLITIVDAMSSYGGIEIDLKVTDVDYLISSSNKCIQAMAGLGIIIAKKTELSRIKDIKKKSFYFDLSKNYISQSEKGQFLYTPPVQILYSLNCALDEYYLELKSEKRSKRYERLYQEMYKGMIELGFKPLIKENLNSKILTTFHEPSDEKYCFELMHSYLYERGITIYPGKVSRLSTFRISNIGDLSLNDIKDFLGAMKSYLIEKDIKL